MIFNTRIRGKSCRCKVDERSPVFDPQILDMNNQPVPALLKYVDNSTFDQLYEEFCIKRDAEYFYDWKHALP